MSTRLYDISVASLLRHTPSISLGDSNHESSLLDIKVAKRYIQDEKDELSATYMPLRKKKVVGTMSMKKSYNTSGKR